MKQGTHPVKLRDEQWHPGALAMDLSAVIETPAKKEKPIYEPTSQYDQFHACGD
jgi:hypothetical protein